MAFYLLMNGNIKPHTFDYLDGSSEKARLEKTLPHGKKKSEENPAPKGKSFFAIEIMSKKVITLSSDATLDDAVKLLKDKNIHHIPVLDESGNLKGLISDRDLLALRGDTLYNLISLKDVMSKIVIIAEEETDIGQLARVLVRENVSAIPIVDKEMNLTGIVSRVDILKTVVYHQFLE